MITAVTDLLWQVIGFAVLGLFFLMISGAGKRLFTNTILGLFFKLPMKVFVFLKKRYLAWAYNVMQGEAYQKQIANIQDEGIKTLKPLVEKAWKYAEYPSLLLFGAVLMGWTPLLPIGRNIWQSLVELATNGTMTTTLWLVLLGAFLVFVLILPFVLDLMNRKRSDRYGTSQITYYSPLLKSHHKGLVINGANLRLTESASMLHLALISPSGSGKSTRFCIPSILQCTGSQIIVDVKGELYFNTSSALRSKGYNIITLDVEDCRRSHKFNPLKRLETAQDIRGLATYLFESANPNSNVESVWKEPAIGIISILISCLKRTEEKYQTMAQLVYLLNQIRVTPLEETDGRQHDPIDYFVAKYAPDHETVMEYARIIDSMPKILLSQIITAVSTVSMYNTPDIRFLTSSDDFGYHFEELRQQKTALYLKLPVGKSESFKPFVSLFMQQLFLSIMSTPVKDSDQSIYCILDEFSNIKKIDIFPSFISLARSYRCSVSICVQDYFQIINTYGADQASVILENCASLIAYSGIKSSKTLGMIEERLGITTFTEYDQATGRFNESRRSVMNKDEISRLGDDLLFLHAGQLPVKTKAFAVYQNQALMKANGLKSVNNRLVSTLPPVERPERPNTPTEYLPLEIETIQFETKEELAELKQAQ